MDPQIATVQVTALVQAQAQAHVSMEKKMEDYVATLSPKERKGYEIARSHLETSFDLEKSNGFIQWCKTTAAAGQKGV
jgi:hypothetical protein